MKLRTTALAIIFVLVVIMLVFIVFSLMLDTSSASSAQVATYPPVLEIVVTQEILYFWETPTKIAIELDLPPTPSFIRLTPSQTATISPPLFIHLTPNQTTTIQNLDDDRHKKTTKGELIQPLPTATATPLSRILGYSVQQIENILFMINPEYLNVGPR